MQVKQLKAFEQIVLDALHKGWDVNTDALAKGADWISIRDTHGQVPSNNGTPRQISYNVTNGHFFVFKPSANVPIASHESIEFKDEEWYKAILDLLYYSNTDKGV